MQACWGPVLRHWRVGHSIFEYHLRMNILYILLVILVILAIIYFVKRT